MKPLNEPADIGALLNESKRRAEAHLGNNVIRDEHGPRRKVHLRARLSKALVQLGYPIADARIDERLHLLNITERVFWRPRRQLPGTLISRRAKERQLTRPRGDLPEVRMLLAVLHIEQRLCRAETSSDVVLRLVGLPTVDVR